MRIHTDKTMAAATLRWWAGDEARVSLIVKTTFSLQSQRAELRDPLPLSEDIASRWGGLHYASDFVPWKRQPEVLVSGQAYWPEETHHIAISLFVGDALVKRCCAITELPARTLPLHPSYLRDRPQSDERVRLGPQWAPPQLWSSRRLPAEDDFGAFNSAPDDQRVSALLPGMRLVTQGLTPDREWFEAQLPLYRPSAFVMDAEGDAVELQPLVCDTICLNSELGTLQMVWRGVLRNPADSAQLVVVGAERALSESDWEAAQPPDEETQRRTRSAGTPSVEMPSAGMPHAGTPSAGTPSAARARSATVPQGPLPDEQTQRRMPSAGTPNAGTPSARIRSVTLPQVLESQPHEALPFQLKDAAVPPLSMESAEGERLRGDTVLKLEAGETMALRRRPRQPALPFDTQGTPVFGKHPEPIWYQLSPSLQALMLDQAQGRVDDLLAETTSDQLETLPDFDEEAFAVAPTPLPGDGPNATGAVMGSWPSRRIRTETVLGVAEDSVVMNPLPFAPSCYVPAPPQSIATEPFPPEFDPGALGGGFRLGEAAGKGPMLGHPSTLGGPHGDGTALGNMAMLGRQGLRLRTVTQPAIATETVAPSWLLGEPGQPAHPPFHLTQDSAPAQPLPAFVRPPSPLQHAPAEPLVSEHATTSPPPASEPEQLPLEVLAAVKAALLDGVPLNEALAAQQLSEGRWITSNRKLAIELAREATADEQPLAQALETAIAQAREEQAAPSQPLLQPIGYDAELDLYVTIKVELEEAEDPAAALDELGLTARQWEAQRRRWTRRALLEPSLASRIRHQLAEKRSVLRSLSAQL